MPQALNYQAIARTPDGSIISGQSIGVRFSILDGSTTSPVVYQETHLTRTNNFGLFTLFIGKGSVASGAFSAISWGVGSKYLRVEIAPQGGNIYQLQGVTQLLSVPYALYAENSGTPGPQGLQGPQGIEGPIGQQGANGINGKTILNGNVNPVNTTGVDGDFYINTATNQLFGPKTAGVWGLGVNLTGPTGPHGLKSLIDLQYFGTDATCTTGGVTIKSGIDQNNNNVLDPVEVDNVKHICFTQSSNPQDRLIILPIDWSANTTNTTPVSGIGIIKFNKNNYPGVDSIILVCKPYVGNSSNTAIVKLYNFTDNTTVNNGTISTNNLFSTSAQAYLVSGNVFSSLPNYEIALGVSLQSSNEGIMAATGSCFLYLYRH